jgi:hypothetical protein
MVLLDDGNVGDHAQEAGDQAAQVDPGPGGPGGAGLHLGHVGHGDVGLEHLLGQHRATAGSSYPTPGGPANTIDSRAHTPSTGRPPGC